MTMLFTHQPAPIHTFDHNVCSRGSSGFQDAFAAQKKALTTAPLQYRAPDLSDKRSTVTTAMSKPLHESLDQQSTILMPCPKKVSVLTVNTFLSGGVSSGFVTPAPASATLAPTAARWGLSSVLEDAQEDDAAGFEATATTATVTAAMTTTTDDEEDYFDQAACAELMEIMSSGSSRSSSNTSSPQPILDPAASSDATRCSLDEFSFVNRFDDDNDLFLPAPPQSPIVRANNPLPNDTSFSPAQLEITKHFEAFLARHRSQAKVFDFNLNVD